MNRFERRRMEARRNRFLAQQQNTIQWTPEEMAVRGAFVKFAEDLKAKGQMVTRINGALGEWKGCDAFVERIIRPENGGFMYKLWGNSFLLKGSIEVHRVHGLELAKSMISEIFRDIFARDWLYISVFVFRFLFSRKRFVHFLDHIFHVINYRSVKWFELPDDYYNDPVRELRRASYKVIKDQYDVEWNVDLDDWRSTKEEAFPTADKVKYQPKQFGYLLTRMTKFFCLLLELDTAYRFRVQDAFGKLQSTDGIDRFFEGLDVLISREVKAEGVAHKWKFIKRLAKLFLFFEPRAKRYIKALFEEIDFEKVKMDEHDWYFCLRYISYNFGGLSQDERFALRDQIDKENQHVFLV